MRAGKWAARFEAEGAAGLQDGSSRPRTLTLHRPTPKSTQEAILTQRRQRLTGRQIARHLAVFPTTASRALRRHGQSRIYNLEPPAPIRRYERERSGELIQIDIKKLDRFERVGLCVIDDRAWQSSGRGIGCEYLQLAGDGHSYFAYPEIRSDHGTGRPDLRLPDRTAGLDVDDHGVAESRSIK